jgi:hypothetical protein
LVRLHHGRLLPILRFQQPQKRVAKGEETTLFELGAEAGGREGGREGGRRKEEGTPRVRKG